MVKNKWSFIIIIAVLGFLFQLLAYVTPGWIVLADVTTIIGRQDLTFSVWYAKYCSRSYCLTVSSNEALGSISNQVVTKSDWSEIEAETTVAIISSLLGIIASLCYLRSGETGRVTMGTITAIVSFFLSGIILIIPMGKVSHMNEKLQDILQHNNNLRMQLMVPYCTIVAGIGSFLELVAAVSFSCSLHSAIQETKRTNTRERQASVIISVVSNQAAQDPSPPSYQEVMEGCYNSDIVPPSYQEAVEFMGTIGTKPVEKQTMEVSRTIIDEH